VAVNFSPIQFERSGVAAFVRETLAATNLPANRLEIEITESTCFGTQVGRYRTYGALRHFYEIARRLR